MIELNFSNMMTEVLGEKGISERQLEALRDRIGKAHREISERRWEELAFMDFVSQDISEIREMAQWAKRNFQNFLVLGIGGSALGPRAIIEALSPFHNLSKSPRVFICDNADPRTLGNVLSLCDITKSVANVITKSGSTAETMAGFMVIWGALWNALGDNAKDRILAITDPEKGNLRTIAREKGFRTLSIP